MAKNKIKQCIEKFEANQTDLQKISEETGAALTTVKIQYSKWKKNKTKK